MLYIARIVESYLEEDNELIIKGIPETGAGLGGTRRLKPPSPVPFDALGSGFISRPELGQRCVVWSDPMSLEDSIITYLASPGVPTGGVYGKISVDYGGFLFKCGGYYPGFLELTRSGSITAFSAPFAKMSIHANTEEIGVVAKRYSVEAAGGLERRLLDSTTRATLYQGVYMVKEDVEYLDWENEDPFVGESSVEVGDEPEYISKTVVKSGVLEGEHLYQLDSRHGFGKKWPEMLTGMKLGRQPGGTGFELFGGHVLKDRSDEYRVLWGEGGYRHYVGGGAGKITGNIGEPLGKNFRKKGFLPERGYEWIVEAGVDKPWVGSWSQDAFRERFVFDKGKALKTSSWGGFGEHVERVWEAVVFSEVYDHSAKTWKSSWQIGSGPEFLEVKEKHMLLQNSLGNKVHVHDTGVSVLAVGDNIILKNGAEAEIKLGKDTITLKTGKMELKITPTGLTLNGAPLVYGGLVDFIKGNTSKWGLGAPPGAPAPMFPGAVAAFVPKAVPGNGATPSSTFLTN